jgi:acylphosphatase
MARSRTTIARRYVVHGRVQGVGFRYFVEREALQLGLDGYVRNRADRTVEVYASGRPDQLNELKQLLERGPASSRVDNVEEHQSEPGQRTGFGVEF